MSTSNLDEVWWETGVVREAQGVLFGAVGEKGGEWEVSVWKGGSGGRQKVGRRGDLGEGGMYI
jgi:hypothetical protein